METEVNILIPNHLGDFGGIRFQYDMRLAFETGVFKDLVLGCSLE